jgi:hypothetical protein
VESPPDLRRLQTSTCGERRVAARCGFGFGNVGVGGGGARLPADLLPSQAARRFVGDERYQTILVIPW